jgi:hypothetical protein
MECLWKFRSYAAAICGLLSTTRRFSAFSVSAALVKFRTLSVFLSISCNGFGLAHGKFDR